MESKGERGYRYQYFTPIRKSFLIHGTTGYPADQTLSASLTIDRTAPTFNSTNTVSINGNATAVQSVEMNEATFLTISGGADAALFSINSLTSQSAPHVAPLSFISAPDFGSSG